MFENITLKFTDSHDIVIPTKGITIFVGPNNSGKSLVLREFELLSQQGVDSTFKVIRDFEVYWPSEKELDDALEKFAKLQHHIDHQAVLGHIDPRHGLQFERVTLLDFKLQAKRKEDKTAWARQYARWGFTRLDGRSRFYLTDEKEAGDLTLFPQNILRSLFDDEKSRSKVQDIVYDAFNVFLTIDPTKVGWLRLKVSPEKPVEDEQSLNSYAREYFRKAIGIEETGDGVQAFVGITAAVFSGEFHSVLIDEPEAFLHPPLARKLGRHLARSALEKNGTLMASTHSPDFLMGCIQEAKNVQIVRLEYVDGKSRGKLISPEVLGELLRRPLMRSANVVSSLFHDGVVITESDNDRAFYSEIYYRLSEQSGGAFPSVLFINAQNKQTIKDIVGPLRAFGVPAAAITDIDIIKDGGKTWLDWMAAAKVPLILRDGFSNQRIALKARFDAGGRDMKTEGGVAILSPDDRLAADQFFNTVGDYGIFVVRGGELENWLSQLGVQGKKTDWTINMLGALGSDPASSAYVRPEKGDVWGFMAKIASWVRDASRKGTP
ncbi:AAA family ATPase [Mesorhizobium sp. M0296]|uniref:ATP-dependent nuclease n=1 Tax=Mesorhizobium sp. M0296 TaxID=2956931 RepID=UPI00333BA6C3